MNDKLVEEVARMIANEHPYQMKYTLSPKELARKIVPIISKAIEEGKPKCPGVIVNRTARQMGYTIAPNESSDILEEKEIACPILSEVRKAVEEELYSQDAVAKSIDSIRRRERKAVAGEIKEGLEKHNHFHKIAFDSPSGPTVVINMKEPEWQSFWERYGGK